MDLNDYQAMAHRTAVYPNGDKAQSLYYAGLGLAGETGEVTSKLAKYFRGDTPAMNDELVDSIIAELGDVLWYVSEMTTVLGLTLDEVARRNVQKLTQRLSMGTLRGDGDAR